MFTLVNIEKKGFHHINHLKSALHNHCNYCVISFDFVRYKSSLQVTIGLSPTVEIELDGTKGVLAEAEKSGAKQANKLFVFISNKPFLAAPPDGARKKRLVWADFETNPEAHLPDGVIVICHQNFQKYFRSFATNAS